MVHEREDDTAGIWMGNPNLMFELGTNVNWVMLGKIAFNTLHNVQM